MTIPGTDNGGALGAGNRATRQQRFEFEVKSSYFRDAGKIRLASVSPDMHMNFIIMPDRVQHTSITVSADDARAVRDALIRAYPLEEKKPEPSEYTVRPSAVTNEWLVERAESKMVAQVVIVARTRSEDNAKKIAQALNEAEGL